jgi:hypothetical protein
VKVGGMPVKGRYCIVHKETVSSDIYFPDFNEHLHRKIKLKILYDRNDIQLDDTEEMLDKKIEDFEMEDYDGQFDFVYPIDGLFLFKFLITPISS